MSQGCISPGATIGVLGSGQLGRMFTFAAQRMGYHVVIWSQDRRSPAGRVANDELVAPFTDMDRVQEFAQGVDVVTVEFENLPASTLEALGEFVPVRPAPNVLYTTQNRLREKTFLCSHGFPVPDFRPVEAVADLPRAAAALSPPLVVKTASWGYDGKGQMMVRNMRQLADLQTLPYQEPLIVEKFVDYQAELSVVVTRGFDRSCRAYAPFVNRHENHILDTSISPGNISPTIQRQAMECASEIATSLDAVGVICVEFFLTSDDHLLVNEIAPRTHNSGHLTIDAHATCQFEQQVRSVCGLPLGAVDLLAPAAMANLLGDLWRECTPDWQAALQLPKTRLHLYGKDEPRPGRKMGHITALASTSDEALATVLEARKRLTAGG